MLITNTTADDYWFGPLHLLGGNGQTLTVDDTTATSLYLTSDEVADAINNLYLAGKITVTSAALPFPRPTGVPQLHHGDGSPEGIVFAPQGSLYMRRDSTASATSLYTKTTGVTVDTGWQTLISPASPTGVILAYSGSAAPTGWLLCDGAAVSRTTYSGLFNLISTTYGSGDGSTTFNVPDLRGRVAAGFAASGGHSDVSALGNNDGVVLQYRRPKHRHTPHAHTVGYTPGQGAGGGQIDNLGGSYSIYSGSTDGGSGNANDSLDAPGYLVLNHIIKT